MKSDLIGTTLDQYFLLSRIGLGGGSEVYRAHDAENDRFVALKVLPRHLAEQDEYRRRFLREAQMAAGLEHPHILPLLDYGEAAGIPYLVMRLMEGGTLKDFIPESPLPLPFVARVLAPIADALDYAHRRGMIHRDLKPENILFDVDGTVYLGDFGAADYGESTLSLASAGDFVGTVAYSSPEQCRGEPLTPSADIYSLGVILFEVITGRQPFTGPTPLAVMHQHLSAPTPNPLDDRPDLPPALVDVLRMALAKEPSNRYRSAGALNSAFQRALSDYPLVVEPAPPKPAAPPPPEPAPAAAEHSPSSAREPFRFWLLSVMIVAVVIVALLALALTQ